MTYQVLARKWRPQSFNDLVGQEHVVKALVNALETGRLHHAYLFTGTRGVGKTTIARIFAKSLNCETGITAEPCNQCSICKDITEGRFFDLIEVDAASNTQVEKTRELLENAQYKPTSGRFKVYIIDEVHMFSTSSFNALLKTLEEPPEHVKFLLATTELEKLPATVLSRCLQFNLKSMPQSLLAEHLSTILSAENIEFEPAALSHVAKVADGSVRDSLSLVEQVAAIGEGCVRTEVVESLLGILSPDRTLEMVRKIAAGEPEPCMAMIEEMSAFSPDYLQLLGDTLSIMHQLAMQQLVPGASNTSADWRPESLAELAALLSPEEVQLFYQIALQGKRDLPVAPNPREAFEMTILRMLHFRPAAGKPPVSGAGSATGGSGKDGSAKESGPGSNSGEAASSAPVATTNDRFAPVSAVAQKTAQPEKPAEPQAPEQTLEPDVAEAVVAKPVAAAAIDEPVAVAASASALGESPAPASSESPLTEPVGDVAANGAAPANAIPLSTENWNAVVDVLPMNGATLELARNSSLRKVEQQAGSNRQSLDFVLGETHEELKLDRACRRLHEVLEEYTGCPVLIEFSIGEHAVETAAQRDERFRQEAQQAAEASIAADPMVKHLLERVDGELEHSSIQPVSS